MRTFSRAQVPAQAHLALVDLSRRDVVFARGNVAEVARWLGPPAPGATVRSETGSVLCCDELPHAAVAAGRPFARRTLRLEDAEASGSATVTVEIVPPGLAVVTVEPSGPDLAHQDFLAVATHELKSPIASLHLDLERLRRKFQHAERLEGAEVAQEMERALRQVTRLMRLMQNFIDASQLQNGLFSLAVAPHDLCAIVVEVLETLRPVAARAGCTLESTCGDPLHACWDKLRIEQVVHNLVMNAIKYAASGKRIEVDLSRTGAHARLCVRDHGPGVPEDEVRRVFEPFSRVSPLHMKQSLGLGLFVVREIVAAHGGRIWVEATEGGGATFVAELPLRESQAREDG